MLGSINFIPMSSNTILAFHKKKLSRAHNGLACKMRFWFNGVLVMYRIPLSVLVVKRCIFLSTVILRHVVMLEKKR